MDYKIFKLKFLTPVHFGKTSLDDSECSFCADMLFSALCHEAVNSSCLDAFVDSVNKGAVLFSDAFPFIRESLLIPKPYLTIDRAEKTGDSLIKKAFKKLKYIPVESINEYLSGDFDVLNATSLSELGVNQTKISVAIRGLEESMPYEVGFFSFNDNCGLYFIVAYDSNENLDLITSLVKSLSYSGIGGKRNSGFGRFDIEIIDVPKTLLERISATGNRYMSLSIGLPSDEELDVILVNSQYSLVKRSGFIMSDTYSTEQRRKRDLYLMSAGSCFDKKFSGDIFDVSDDLGSHPVFRYAKPIFMEVSI